MPELPLAYVDPADRLAPTPERRRHSRVETASETVKDTQGRISWPYRAFDTLATMERRGSITAAMRQAGEDFRAAFAAAHLDPLKCQDLARPRVDNAPRPDIDRHTIAARGAVWDAVRAVGGIASPAGSCLWQVVGWEQSLKDWAAEQGWNGRRLHDQAAAGILIAALGVLAEFYRLAD